MSPPRSYWVGDDSKTCDYVVDEDRLGPRPFALVHVDDQAVSIPAFSPLEPGVSDSARPRITSELDASGVLSATIDDLRFEVRWSDDPALRASWSDFATASKKSGFLSESYSHTVTCVVTMPIRTRCPSCGTRLEGSVTAKGTGISSENLGVAETDSREDALAEARREVLLAACPRCRHRPAGRVIRFGIEVALAIAALVTVPALLLLGHMRGRVNGSVFIPSIIGGGVLVHHAKMWFGASRVRLQPAIDRDGTASPYREPAPPTGP